MERPSMPNAAAKAVTLSARAFPKNWAKGFMNSIRSFTKSSKAFPSLAI